MDKQQCQQHDKTTAAGRFSRRTVNHVQATLFFAGLAMTAQVCRSTISFLMSAIALAGLSPFGQALAQFMMVWQR